MSEPRSQPPRRRVRPFPFSELPRLLHSEVEGLRAVSRHLFPLIESLGGPDAGDDGEDPRDAADEVGLRPRLARATGGTFSVVGYECYMLPAVPAELSARAHGALCVALERIGPGQLRAALLVDETLCQRLGLYEDDAGSGASAGGALASWLRQVLAGAPVRVGRALAAEELPGHLQPPRLQGGGTAEGAGALFCLDATLATAVGGGWTRLLCESRLRFRAPPSMAPLVTSRPGPGRARLAGAQVTLAIEAGYGHLPLAGVLGLASGDIVLLDHFGPRPVVGGPIELCVGGGAFPAHLDGNGITITGRFRAPFRSRPQGVNVTVSDHPRPPAPSSPPNPSSPPRARAAPPRADTGDADDGARPSPSSRASAAVDRERASAAVDRERAGAAVDRERAGAAGGFVDRERAGAAGGFVDRERAGAAGGFVDRERAGAAGGIVDRERASAAAALGDDPRALLHEIPVLVTCEIGRVTMNGQEVLELRPGAVIPVGRPLAGPVDLRAGERLIARGELVDIEGELGVRLTEVLS